MADDMTVTTGEEQSFIDHMREKVARSKNTWPDDWRTRFSFYDGEVANLLDELNKFTWNGKSVSITVTGTPTPYGHALMEHMALMEPPVENGFLVLVEHELKRARAKHPKPMNSHHEAYAVVLEELEEAWAEVKGQTPNVQRIIAELVQVAAMCNRWVEDVCAPEFEETPQRLTP